MRQVIHNRERFTKAERIARALWNDDSDKETAQNYVSLQDVKSKNAMKQDGF